ncbi:MAG: hypothetical protein JO353_05060 [Phycisphaerae bacterium]|nr:hypothetical protein [Phycisphaerae bacterium]
MPADFDFTVDDVLDDHATFAPGALAAVRAFARSKPWAGSNDERLAKFNACLARLCEAYGMPQWMMELGDRPSINFATHRFVHTRLSVVTFLHSFAIARGQSDFSRFRWSINMFRRCFPASFARCERVGPFLFNGREVR